MQKILDKHSEMINDVSSSGDSALMYGILSGSLETVVALLEGGADLSIVASKGLTPFHQAAKRDHHEILEVLAVHPDGEFLIDEKDKYGRSALDIAKVLTVTTICAHVTYFLCLSNLSTILHQDMNNQKSLDVLLMYGAALSKRGSIRMSKEVKKARMEYLKEKEEERKAALEDHSSISLA